MLELILGLIPGGGITALAAIGVATLTAIGIISRKATIAERNCNKVKEAETRARNLNKVKAAVDASGRVRPDDGMLNDPYNRDP